MFVCVTLFTMLGAVSARFTANSDEGNASQTSLLQVQLKMERTEKNILKFGFIGAPGSGRHSLVTTMIEHEFREDRAWSHGLLNEQFKQFSYTMGSGAATRVYDITIHFPGARQEGLLHNNRAIRADQYGGTPDVYLIGFDATDRVSFNEAITTWFNEVQDLQGEFGHHVPVMFVGLKDDPIKTREEADATRVILARMDELERQEDHVLTPREVIRREALRRTEFCSAKGLNGIETVLREATRLATTRLATVAQEQNAQVQAQPQPVEEDDQPGDQKKCNIF